MNQTKIYCFIQMQPFSTGAAFTCVEHKCRIFHLKVPDGEIIRQRFNIFCFLLRRLQIVIILGFNENITRGFEQAL